jgi:hypothetical protein
VNSLEDLVALFAKIPPADGDRWVVETLVPGRLRLSRGTRGEFAVFLQGTLESFGAIPAWAGLAHSASVRLLPGGEILAALRIVSQDHIHGNRVTTHIAYELARRLDATPGTTNAELLSSVSWILPLLGDQSSVLSVERQYGLLGECVLLNRLLGIAARLGLPGRTALTRWKGAGHSKRDFAALGVAIEVKTTAHATRLHHFGSIQQLDPQSADEQVFLFSLGLRLDPSAPKKLPDFLADIEAGLVTKAGSPDDEAVSEFRACLKRYGYDSTLESFYRSQPGVAPPHLLPTLYRETELDRVRSTSFKGDMLPTMVVNVGYDLEVFGTGLSSEAEEEVLERLLRAAALTPAT